MKIDWTRVKEGFTIMDVLKEENKELCEENNRLNNIIKKLEVDLRNMYLTFGEFSEEYTEKKIRELKGDDKNDKS